MSRWKVVIKRGKKVIGETPINAKDQKEAEDWGWKQIGIRADDITVQAVPLE